MAKTRDIKSRIKAVGNIKRITKTMQMIATAKFQSAQKRALAAQAYTRKIAELVGELGSAGGAAKHPLLRAPARPTGRHLLLVLTSNRGLCGGYNAGVLRAATAFRKQDSGRKTDLEVVGKKGMNYFRFTGVGVSQFHSQFTDTPSLEAVEQLADRYMKSFTEGRYDGVWVAYMAFHSAARQSPAVLPLLPLKGLTEPRPADTKQAVPAKPVAQVMYDFSPGPAELLEELLPIAVRNQLRQCFNEAAVGEHVARMIAMKSATDSAGKMGKELTRKYNRARQAAITTELSEIIAGSAALK